MFFFGRLNNVRYPAPVKLDGKYLPWVLTAEHLGHTFHQMCTMEQDCKIKRAKFIRNSTEIREQLSFANPEQVMRGIQVFCCDAYGAMLWQLNSEPVEKLFRSWNTCMKYIHDIPRDTFTYLVEDYFAKGFTSMRNQVLSRYSTFFFKLLNSPSKEIRLVANIVARDPSSTTAKNIKYIERLTTLSPWDFTTWRIKEALPIKTIPEKEVWRLGLLDKLTEIKKERNVTLENSESITAMLHSLCNS